jgi:hypothetical protein
MDQTTFLQERILVTLRELLRVTKEIHHELVPHLENIEIVFKIQNSTETGETAMAAPVAGPVILTSAGETATASILGFDQFGNPWTGIIPPVTYVSSDTAGAIIKSVPNADGVTDVVTAVGNGVANLTATLSTAEGLSLTDTESVTVALATAPPPPTPVLSSIKIAFD